jgi:hypothetical protein
LRPTRSAEATDMPYASVILNLLPKALPLTS